MQQVGQTKQVTMSKVKQTTAPPLKMMAIFSHGVNVWSPIIFNSIIQPSRMFDFFTSERCLCEIWRRWCCLQAGWKPWKPVVLLLHRRPNRCTIYYYLPGLSMKKVWCACLAKAYATGVFLFIADRMEYDVNYIQYIVITIRNGEICIMYM